MKLSRILLTSALACCLAPLGHASVVVYYPFDADAKDAAPAGQNPDGALSGAAVIATAPGVAKYGAGALALSGGGDAIGTFQFGNTFSITAWINPSSSATIQSLVSTVKAGGTGNGFNFFILGSHVLYGANTLWLESGNGTDVAYTITTPGVIAFDTYQFVTLTVDRTTGVSKIYVNGVDLTHPVVADTRTDFSTNNPTSIGKFITPGTDYPYSGAIDEVMIYDTVLTPAEIVAAYLVPEPGTCTSLLAGTALLLGLRRRRG